jgi:protein-tyrosine phosphatase
MKPFRLEGAPNFRDLGGRPAAHGRSVRTGKIFRSDHLGHLSRADIDRLHEAYGRKWRVVDFRGVNERATTPCTLPHAQVHFLPIEPTVVQKLTDLLATTPDIPPETTVSLMQATYRGFVENNTHRFAAFFQHVLSDTDTPLVFHCTAGKDRTGFAAALLLHALGVPLDVLWLDYLESNQRRHDKPATSSLPDPIAHVLHAVQREFLQAALDAVTAAHGGMEAYLHNALGMTPHALEKLRHAYLG